MNTPNPCDKCHHLYWNVLREDDPLDSAVCKLDLRMGDINCPKFTEFDAERSLCEIENHSDNQLDESATLN